jgi:hypothetical protein
MVNYQFSKLIEQRSFLNSQDPFLNKQIAGDDRPHRLVASGNWELPFGRDRAIGSGLTPVLNWAISGWSANPIYTIQSGAPLDWGNLIYYGGDLNVDSRNIDQAFDTSRFNRNSKEQLSNNLRSFPKYFGSLRRDGINTMDLSLIKDNQITEHLKLQFRCEFFNFMNHPNFGQANRSATSSDFGRITSQSNLPRTTQMALRLSW